MFKNLLLALVFCGLAIFKTNASDIIEVLPLTDKIIMIHFDDGGLTYPNTLSVVRLLFPNATTLSNYSISSSDDADYTSAKNPIDLGRKTKGTEFVKDPPWDGGMGSSNPTTKPWASEHWIYIYLDKALKDGKNYTLNTGSLASNGSNWSFTYNIKTLRSEAVHVNTVGYAKDAPKYGYIYHWMGDKGGLSLTAYAGKTFWIYKNGTSGAVKTGTIAFRKNASNEETAQTGDSPNKNFLGGECYEANFSDVTSDGTYTLVVDGIGCSYPFKIGTDAVFEAYYAAMRSIFYQRSGIRLASPYTDGTYLRPVNQNTKVTSDDGVSFAGKLLYSDLAYTEWENGDGGGTTQSAIRDAAAGKTLDVAGWYHDAGDWDQYYTHERVPILLMLTYEFAPEKFADADLNLPESGNGIPDILDEASWLIKFNYRLRKELKAKGYSNGGVGGARICADVFTSVDGDAEGTRPSWKEMRRTIVTKADAFMTYLYAGQAAQFACILKKIGKNPKSFQVEMLDNVSFASMTKDNVNWITEATEAFDWAADPANQPANHNNFESDINIYKLYAAVNLYRLTGLSKYHNIAKAELENLRSKSSLGGDERWGVYSYLLATNYNVDQSLMSDLETVATSAANVSGYNASVNRGCRWGGDNSMPMLVGQATTPWVFENIIAYKVSNDIKYSNTVHTTADYFLGNNPLHTTWMTGIGPRGLKYGFHLDSRYINPTTWNTYPGFTPYGPWSMAYGFDPVTYTIDGVSIQGGKGPWNKDWANFSVFPTMDQWPGHERYNSNVHSPMSSENTVHQNAVFTGLTYGFVNERSNTNTGSLHPINTITLDKTSITFTMKKEESEITASVDASNATFAALVWSSSNTAVAVVDQFGRVTAIGNGICNIFCKTLDNSVSISCDISCNSLADVPVSSVTVAPNTLTIGEGLSRELSVTILPDNATNQSYTWDSEDPTIANVVDDVLTAVNAGTVKIWAISSADASKKGSIDVTVTPANYTILADFDNIIPVTTTPQPTVPQIHSGGAGTLDINATNPLKNSKNNSDVVLKYGHPAATWKLIGMVLPTENQPAFCMHKQFQFKYYGAGLKNFRIKMVKGDGTALEVDEDAAGLDDWTVCSITVPPSGLFKEFLIFVNKDDATAFDCYFDDFRLVQNEGGVCVESSGILDFETIQLNWTAGYGAYSWATATTAIAANPLMDAENSSDKVFQWNRDDSNFGAGFGIVFPKIPVSTWDKLSFQVYTTVAINKIEVQMKYGDPAVDEGVVTLDNLNIPANTWTEVKFPLSSLNADVDTIDRVQMSPAVGTHDILTFYMDNVMFKDVSLSSITMSAGADFDLEVGQDTTLTLSFAPSNATEKSVEWLSNHTNFATVVGGLVTAVAKGVATITAKSIANPTISDAVIINVTDHTGIEDLRSSGIRVYPNPAHGEVFINNSMLKMKQISLTDISGKVIYTSQGFETKNIMINLSGIRSGLYLLNIETEDKIVHEKLIIK